MESIIRLFKALPIEFPKKKNPSKKLLSETVRRGFVFSPQVVGNYSEDKLFELIDVISKEVGLTSEQMNSSFHKSWLKVKDASEIQLVFEQIFHYLTTYGFENLGIYDKDSVYIPSEVLKIPGLKDNIPLVVIKGYTKQQLKAKLLEMLRLGVAIKKQTMDDLVNVALLVELGENEIESIQNKETRCVLYSYLGKLPRNPVEFLRFMIYTSINKTLIIKNPATIKEIKSKDNIDVTGLLHKYLKEYGYEKLAEIFYRFKPLFLAFRTNYELKRIVNRIRREAVRHHKPMVADYLNDVTTKLKLGKPIHIAELRVKLAEVNAFRKIRLASALYFRLSNPDSILYKIRNGKGFAAAIGSVGDKDSIIKVFNEVLRSIINDVAKNVKGKKFYIPEYVNYALPATEKQFTGDLPSGTYISIPKDMIVGIHWDNVEENRIDLDLSLVCAGGKYGWDASYRSSVRDVLFSGDMTDARPPDGASELFYVGKQAEGVFLLFVNYFNFREGAKVPFKILVAKEEVKDFRSNYTVNPNNIFCMVKSIIDVEQKLLGLLVSTPIESRFYFAESDLGKSIISSSSVYAEHARKYLMTFFTNTISLKDVLEQAGAKAVIDKKKADIDLSLETLEKDKILALFK